jgi:hypothetical protein
MLQRIEEHTNKNGGRCRVGFQDYAAGSWIVLVPGLHVLQSIINPGK